MYPRCNHRGNQKINMPTSSTTIDARYFLDGNHSKKTTVVAISLHKSQDVRNAHLQSKFCRLLCHKTGTKHHTWVRCVGTTRDGSNHHTTMPHLCGLPFEREFHHLLLLILWNSESLNNPRKGRRVNIQLLVPNKRSSF